MGSTRSRRASRRRAARAALPAALVALLLVATARLAVPPGGEWVGGGVRDAPGSASPADVASAGEAPGEGAASDPEAARVDAREFGEVRSQAAPGELADVAARLLEGYERDGGCSLVRSGYLDLLGRTWSCTVLGDGWVDTCVVSEGDGSCEVRVVRMERDLVEGLAREGRWGA